MARLPKVIVPVSGWAWAIKELGGGDRWFLCNWAEPTKSKLVAQYKPSSEAIPVYVRIIAMRDVRRAKKVRP